MSTVLVVIHVLVSIFLIAVVLLQRGKGAEIGAVFGGGASSTVFGSRGAGNFLTKLTTISAVIFMLTSLSLSYVWTQGAEDRLFQDTDLSEELAVPAPGQDEAESLFEEIETVPAEPAPVVPAPVEEPGSLPPLDPPPAQTPAP
ncbi:MAG: preprotein translocase subunit SecG [Myxococcota bacterium]|nr:preprotein translocase subunit SecG [Myxococcota bacterium]